MAVDKRHDFKLPEGFNKIPEGEEVHFKSQAPGNQAPQVNFRRGPGGPRGMAQTVEKPADTKKTIGRLLVYFSKAKRLLLGLIAAVICVTLVALAAPSLQGEAIDLIKEHQWTELYTCVKLLLCAYLANILFGLAQ